METDPKEVKEILLDIAQNTIKKLLIICWIILPRKFFFIEFGASSLNFILYVWARKYNLPR